MANKNRSTVLVSIQAALSSLHGKPVGRAEAEKVLKYLTSKDVEYFREVLKTTKERLFAATSDSPLMQRVIGLVSDKGKARVSAQIKKDAGVAKTKTPTKKLPKAERQAAAKAVKEAEQATVKEASKQATVAEDVKRYRRYSAPKGQVGELIAEAGPARTAFGSPGKVAIGESGVAIPESRGRLDQMARLRTKLMDPETNIRESGFIKKQVQGVDRKKVVDKALNTKANRAAFREVRQQFKDAGVKPGRDLNKLMSNIKKDLTLMSKIGGGAGLGEKAIIEGARAGAPIKSTFGSKGGLMELMGMGSTSKDTISVAALTEGVGSKAGKLAGKVFRFGVPLAVFEAFTVVPRLAREVGLDTEFNTKMDAIEEVSAGISHESLAAEYKRDKLIASHKARLTREDPMAMQFLAGAMANGGLPQKLTQNEVMIGGAPSDPRAQSLAGDEIARALMGM